MLGFRLRMLAMPENSRTNLNLLMIFVVPGLLSSALGCGGSSATASDVRMQEAQLEARRRTQERYAELLRLQNGSAGGEIADGEEPVGVTVNDVPIDPRDFGRW